MDLKIGEGMKTDKIFILQAMKNWPSLKMLLEGVDIFPLMGEHLVQSNTLTMDFSTANLELNNINFSDTTVFNHYVFEKLASTKKKYGIGGYFEHRAIYQRSEVFVTDLEDFRNIHLGVDVWAEAGTAVYAPIDGKVYSFQNNQGFGDYGPTIILKHLLKGEKLYSLYGHLKLTDLENLEVGKPISQGERFCHLGPFPENGDWPPHLHFQLMWDLLGNWGDFPGVCSHREIEKFKNICPDPNLMVGYSSR